MFSYGSNNPPRLAQRIGRPVKGTAAFLPGYVRVFRGRSSTWNWHGVASVELQADGYVFGYVEPLSEEELEILDGYEGIYVNAYRREHHTVKVLNEATDEYEPRQAIVYVATSKEKNMPNYAYLAEVAKTINTFWDDDGEITPADIEIR